MHLLSFIYGLSLKVVYEILIQYTFVQFSKYCLKVRCLYTDLALQMGPWFRLVDAYLNIGRCVFVWLLSLVMEKQEHSPHRDLNPGLQGTKHATRPQRQARTAVTAHTQL